MGYYADTDSHRKREVFPAYGPIDSILGFAMFYVFVDRATPTIVEVLTGAVPSFSPSTVSLWLALALWFIFVVTLVDIARHQLSALGIASEPDEETSHGPRVLSSSRAVLYIAAVVVGGLVAAWAFEPAVETGISMIRIVGTLDVSAFDPAGFLVMILFFIAYAGATRALDRLVIGGFRAVLTE